MFKRDKLTGSITEFFRVDSPRLPRVSADFALPDNFIGVEQEVEGAPRQAYQDAARRYNGPRGWTHHTDDSLRNNGIELVSAHPMLGEQLMDSLVEFEAWFHRWNMTASFRTSTHVHVDFSQPRDTLHLIQDFLMGYYILEEGFFGFGDSRRKYAGYCVAFRDADFELLDILSCANAKELHRQLQETKRYYACNPASLTNHGTIEFRHLPLTVGAERVKAWINVILRLKKFMLDNTTEEVSFLGVLSTVGIEGFAQQVFGDEYERLKHVLDMDDMAKKFSLLMSVYGEKRVTMPPAELVVENPLYGKLVGNKPAAITKKGLKAKLHEPFDAADLTRMLNEVRVNVENAAATITGYDEQEPNYDGPPPPETWGRLGADGNPVRLGTAGAEFMAVAVVDGVHLNGAEADAAQRGGVRRWEDMPLALATYAIWLGLGTGDVTAPYYTDGRSLWDHYFARITQRARVPAPRFQTLNQAVNPTPRRR